MTDDVDRQLDALSGLDFDVDLSSPTAHVGEYANEFVDRCKQTFGDDVKLGQVVIVGEVYRESEQGRPYTEVVTLCSDSRELCPDRLARGCDRNGRAYGYRGTRGRDGGLVFNGYSTPYHLDTTPGDTFGGTGTSRECCEELVWQQRIWQRRLAESQARADSMTEKGAMCSTGATKTGGHLDQTKDHQ